MTSNQGHTRETMKTARDFQGAELSDPVLPPPFPFSLL